MLRKLKKNAALAGLVTLSLSLSACIQGEANKSPAEGDVVADALFQQKNITSFDLSNTKKVALTFDDGPSGDVTKELLEVLRHYNIKATFFMVAKNARNQPELAARVAADGHIIASHTYSHQDLRERKYENGKSDLFHQVGDAHEVLKQFHNPSHRWYFRAPYGAWRDSHAAKLNADRELRNYIGPVFWTAGGDISPKGAKTNLNTAADWACWSTGVSVADCSRGYFKEITRKGGGVVLMHDVKMKTVDMVKRLIPALISEGYEFVTLDELRSLDQYQ